MTVKTAARNPSDAPPAVTRTVELFDRSSGLFLSLTAGGNGAVILDRQVIAASPIPADGLDSFRPGSPLVLETERGELEVTLEPAGEPARLRGELIGSREIYRATVRGSLTDRGETVGVDGFGAVHVESRPPVPGRLQRDLSVILDDGGLLCVTAVRPAGSGSHGDEETAAAITHPGGCLEFEQALISTRSDAEGRQLEATLELIPGREDVAVLHGAGISAAGCTARLAGITVNTALFDWKLDSHTGAGRYELARPGRKETQGG